MTFKSAIKQNIVPGITINGQEKVCVFYGKGTSAIDFDLEEKGTVW
jgi:hypothetical protein